ncbi:MAG: hypothetical protein LJE97_09785 [Betaproteobacteria bacterium]|nr:hypothetical protein [Betaproteobacteria bacterium]
MDLERVGVALRPRQPWEAVDLGFVMARQWAAPVYAAFLTVFVPVAVALHLVFEERLWLAALITWWLKPLFDRFALHVVSRAVFGEVPSVRATLAAARDILSPGLLASLTLHRLNLARSLVLPVWQLEKSRGRAARERREILGRRMRGHAVGLTVICVNFEWVVLLSLVALGALLYPAAGEGGGDILGWWRDGAPGWEIADSVAYLTAIAVIEPLYVAAGFALYLNRRAILEGWDVELSLRQLAQRLVATRALAPLACFAVAAALAFCAPDGLARDLKPPETARKEIVEVLKDPAFQEWRDTLRWRYRTEPRPADESSEVTLLSNLGRLLGPIAEFLMWLLAAAAIVAVLLAARRFLPQWIAPREVRYRPPDALFGLNVTPESLPDDPAGTALDLVVRGKLRDALSLLYRGALAALVHTHHVPLIEGHTEGDCMRAARAVLPTEAGRYFERLVGVWQTAAYGGRLPAAEDAADLAREWSAHFSIPRTRAGSAMAPEGAT